MVCINALATQNLPDNGEVESQGDDTISAEDKEKGICGVLDPHRTCTEVEITESEKDKTISIEGAGRGGGPSRLGGGMQL